MPIALGYSSSLVFYHTAGPRQPNSSFLPVLGPSLQVNHTYSHSTWSLLSLHFSLLDLFHQPILSLYMLYPIFLSLNYCLNMDLFSPTFLRASSFVILAVQLMHFILLHIHLFSASVLISSLKCDYVSPL